MTVETVMTEQLELPVYLKITEKAGTSAGAGYERRTAIGDQLQR
jgi:hypothetical protein